MSNIQYSICIKVGEKDNIFNSLFSTILALGFAIIGSVFVLLILFLVSVKRCLEFKEAASDSIQTQEKTK